MSEEGGDLPSISEMVSALRSHGQSLEEIAQAVGVSTQAVLTWQSGRVKNPRLQTRQAMESVYRAVFGRGDDFAPRPAGGSIAFEAVALTGPTGRSIPPDRGESIDVPLVPERHATAPPRTAEEAFRFVHCADLHVDSPLTGIRRIDPRHAERIQMATRRAFMRLVDMAIEDRVAFVVIAGDVFDGDWKSADTGIFVSRQLSRLTQAGIHVFAIAGNHDAVSVVSRSVRWPAGARLMGTEAETFELPSLGVAIHGRSFGARHESSDFIAAYPAPRAGLFNIGLLHTSLAGDVGHATYAPCSQTQLAGIGYDYWALGHVHVPRVVQTGPTIAFSGNIQGRDIGETGERGCFVVTVDGQRRPANHFVALDDVRWRRIEISLATVDVDTIDDVIAMVVENLDPIGRDDDRLTVCRVVLTGPTSLHRRLVSRRGTLKEEVASAVAFQLDGRLCVENVAVETTDPDEAPRNHQEVPGRAIELLEDEFRRLEEMPIEVLLEEVPELRKMFDDLRLLDTIRPGRRDDLQSAASWRGFVGAARTLLEAELSENVRETEERT